MAALLNISAEHPDAENRLLAACCHALQSLGAEVSVRAGADNALRLRVPIEHVRPFGPRAPAPLPMPLSQLFLRPELMVAASPSFPLASVEVEGLPNLLHELVHVALAGGLADDHGYDYGAIPYDLETAAGRAILWEEIACCVVSCAYLNTADASTSASPPANVNEWFAEQLGIQPLFYGMETDPAAFFARVESLAHEHIAELVAMLDSAYERVERLLGARGRRPAPVARLAFAPLWSRWRALAPPALAPARECGHDEGPPCPS